MSVGIFIDGKRPASKKAVREAVAAGDLSRIELENTSFFDNKFDIDLASFVAANPSARVDFVGPDPFSKRVFYGNIVIKAGKVTVK